ncbi:hypothetical protein GE09DRAFT_1255731 [Coniochaeta sp. 2T2.1]|nr:hypothetical protein GE09DRAFT_1255731 [Coniochaeta sp. 2T2.1]
MSRSKQKKTDVAGSSEAVETAVLSEIQLPNEDGKLTKGKPRRRKRHSRKKPATESERTANKENEPPTEDKPATANKPAPEGKPSIKRTSASKHKPADVKENKPSTAATKTKPTPISDVKSSAMSPGKLAVVPTVEHAVNLPANPTATTEIKPSTKPARKYKNKSRSKPKTDDFDVVKEWNQYWGQGNLEDWQRLCQDLGIHGQLKTKDGCREAMKDIWINIHDFLQAHPKQSVTHFPTERDLAAYTKATHKVYPRDKIEKNSPLRLLMGNREYDAWQNHAARRLRREKEKSKPRIYPDDIIWAWNVYIGADALEDLQRFAHDVRLQGEYNTLAECKRALIPVWVNLVDFLVQRDEVALFKSETDLRLYCKARPGGESRQGLKIMRQLEEGTFVPWPIGHKHYIVKSFEFAGKSVRKGN